MPKQEENIEDLMSPATEPKAEAPTQQLAPSDPTPPSVWPIVVVGVLIVVALAWLVYLQTRLSRHVHEIEQ